MSSNRRHSMAAEALAGCPAFDATFSANQSSSQRQTPLPRRSVTRQAIRQTVPGISQLLISQRDSLEIVGLDFIAIGREFYQRDLLC